MQNIEHEEIKGTIEVRHKSWKENAKPLVETYKKLAEIDDHIAEFEKRNNNEMFDHLTVNNEILEDLQHKRTELEQEITWGLKKNPSAKVYIVEYQLNKIYQDSNEVLAAIDWLKIKKEHLDHQFAVHKKDKLAKLEEEIFYDEQLLNTFAEKFENKKKEFSSEMHKFPELELQFLKK